MPAATPNSASTEPSGKFIPQNSNTTTHVAYREPSEGVKNGIDQPIRKKKLLH